MFLICFIPSLDSPVNLCQTSLKIPSSKVTAIWSPGSLIEIENGINAAKFTNSGVPSIQTLTSPPSTVGNIKKLRQFAVSSLKIIIMNKAGWKFSCFVLN